VPLSVDEAARPERAAAPVSGQGWASIVAALASRCELILQGFLGRLAQDREYPLGLVPDAEVRDSALEALRLLVRSFESGIPSRELLDFADAFGAKRANQGVPPESLILAVRLDFDLIWPHLLAVCGPKDAELLSGQVAAVANVINAYGIRTNSAYLSERLRMAHKELNLLQDYIDRLFSRAGQEEEIVANVATVLGVDPGALFSVAAVPSWAVPELRQRATARLRGPGCFVYDDGAVAFAFWQSGRHPNALRIPRSFLEGLVCGLVEDVPSLASVPESAVTARTLLAAATEADRGPLTVDDAWARVAGIESRRAGVDLAAALDACLAACTEAERERLRETLGLFLANGSVVETSALLFCHRNTVLNRLRRFEELTGLDLGVPAHAARAVVALAVPARRPIKGRQSRLERGPLNVPEHNLLSDLR
jgi:hypothetical protein